ncbi:MAG: hypothetical protein IJH94_02410 [Clostridia bacterium]|nr:hypothetical protein [Clostridia bacterium]
MKKYITPEITSEKFDKETIITASAKSDAERQVRMEMTGVGYGLDESDIVAVRW